MTTTIDQIDEISRNVRIEAARGDLLSRSMEVELSALQAYLFDYVNSRDIAPECPDSYDDDFVSPISREIWSAVRSLATDRLIATPAAVLGRMQDRGVTGLKADELREYLSRLAAATAAGRPSDALRLVREMANRRRLADAARELEELAYRLDVQPAEAIGEVSATIEAIRLDRQAVPRSLRDIAMRIADDLQRPLPCYSTGLPRLDKALGGGIYAGKLYGLAAKRKHGKTLTVGTLAGNFAAAGTPTLFFALEMGEVGIAQRIIARHLRTNSLSYLARDNEHLERDTRRFAEVCDMPLFFEDRPGLDFATLRNMASEYVARHGIKVVIVDYWQLVGGRTSRQSLVEHLDRVAQWLADFAKASGAAVICPAQLNRDGEVRSGDGLRLACDMYLVQHKVTQPDGRTDGIWMEMPDSRYTPTVDIGSEDCTPFFINARVGPHLAEFGQ